MQTLIYVAELVVVYGVLWYLIWNNFIRPKPFFLILVLVGLVFSLYYGIKGATSSILCTILLLITYKKDTFLEFVESTYLETSFFLFGILLCGYLKNIMEGKVLASQIYRETMSQRLEKYAVKLSQMDRSLQLVFEEILTETDSPKIIYHVLRRLEFIDQNDFFEEILRILYTHCHVLKSAIYELKENDSFQRVAYFGLTNLPETLLSDAMETPQIIRVAKLKGEVIVPKKLNHQLMMTIPILSISEKLRYIIVLEEIRFMNFTDSLINLLKLTSFWIKYAMELHLNRKELLPLSAYASVIVYREDIAIQRLKHSIFFHKRYNLPFCLVQILGPISEEMAFELVQYVRMYDELFLLENGRLILFLSMSSQSSAQIVINRLKKVFPDFEIEEQIDKEVLSE